MDETESPVAKIIHLLRVPVHNIRDLRFMIRISYSMVRQKVFGENCFHNMLWVASICYHVWMW